MANITLDTRIVLRNDTLANWTTNASKVLLKGEAVIIWDGNTPKIKVGDGASAYSDLPFAFINSADAQSLINTSINGLGWVKNAVISGSGNGIANATYSGNTLTLTKGTFLTSHQDISGKVDKINITDKTIGLYKIAYNEQGQITSSTAAVKADITALGIPAQDTNTTYTFEARESDNSGTSLYIKDNSNNYQDVYIGGNGATRVYRAAANRITIDSTNTTYEFSTGTVLGAFSYDGSDTDVGAVSVPIYGLKSAAYTDSSAYATAAQGTLASNAMPKSGGTFTGAVIGITPTSDMNLSTKKYVDDTVNSKIASVFKFKGTKATFAELPTTGNTIGDVWHVTERHAEYVWAQVDGASSPGWEELGGATDLSGYALKSDIKPLTFKSGSFSSVYNPLSASDLTFVGNGATTVLMAGSTITISSTDNNTVVSNISNNTGKVFTGITNGTTVTTTDVGSLVLTGYASSGDTGAIVATDTITKALNKVYNLANGKNSGTVTSVIAGGGLSGGTITTTGTISHGAKPSSGTVLTTGAGSGLTFLTGISLDTYGHVATATTASVSLSGLGGLGSITAGTGITVAAKSGTTQTVSLDIASTYILNGGNATV